MSTDLVNINPPENTKSERIDNWFGCMLAELQTDRFLMKENLASVETKNHYEDLIFGDSWKNMGTIREQSTQFFIGHLIRDYIKELVSFNKMPKKLALGLSDSKILVWSEIEDNDEATEDALLLAEARVNGKYQSKGFYISSTVVEASDNMSVPPHYQPIL